MRLFKKRYYKPYWCFAILRLLLVFIPQTGFIHPDEFFQTVEPLASRVFEYDADLPWEFNVTSPIRSVGPTYLTIGLSYKLLGTVHFFLRLFLGASVISPYSILITPRILICLLSFLVDYCMYKICVINGEVYKSRLLILSSSYVMIIYGTRTFTNTLELFLFAFLLYYVAESIIFSNVVVKQTEYLNKRYDNSAGPVERAKFYKLRMCIASHSFRNCLQISTITVYGFFNRPTFLGFAIMPLFFWLYRGIGFKSVANYEFYLRTLSLTVVAIPSILFLVLVDSFFYGYITWGEIGMLQISITNFVFTPFNFLKYNINTENLAKHGLHSRYLHVLVNIPLLFNILGVMAFIHIVYLLRMFHRRKYHLLPTPRSIKGLMIASAIVPLAILSLFPHQEPRFLIPLVFPLIYLYGNQIYTQPAYSLVKKQTDGNKIRETSKIKPKESNFLLKIWLLINLLLALFYGFIHQGGVYQVTSYLSEQISQAPSYTYHILTSHMYSIPHVFFMQPNPEKLFYQKNKVYAISRHVLTHEEGSQSMEFILKKTSTILNVMTRNKKRYKMFLLIPGSLALQFEAAVQNHSEFNVHYKRSFYPHFTSEALPDFTQLIHIVAGANLNSLSVDMVVNCVLDILHSFTLTVYETSKT